MRRLSAMLSVSITFGSLTAESKLAAAYPRPEQPSDDGATSRLQRLANPFARGFGGECVPQFRMSFGQGRRR